MRGVSVLLFRSFYRNEGAGRGRRFSGDRNRAEAERNLSREDHGGAREDGGHLRSGEGGSEKKADLLYSRAGHVEGVCTLRKFNESGRGRQHSGGQARQEKNPRP